MNKREIPEQYSASPRAQKPGSWLSRPHRVGGLLPPVIQVDPANISMDATRTVAGIVHKERAPLGSSGWHPTGQVKDCEEKTKEGPMLDEILFDTLRDPSRRGWVYKERQTGGLFRNQSEEGSKVLAKWILWVSDEAVC